MTKPPKVGITHGDINGIGYEVILKSLADERMLEICTPVIFGNSRCLNQYRKLLRIDQFPVNVIASADEARDGHINLVEITDTELKATPGEPTAAGGAAALLALQQASNALKEHHIDALVTAPIDKHSIQGEGFDFPGHTEYLGARFNTDEEHPRRPLMILYADNLRVALATTHLPVREVASAITPELLIERMRALDFALRQDFAIERPTIAVLALNPHAGDRGTLGSEEADIIEPAIVEANKQGLLVFGPFAADGFFGSGAFARFDGILAMYHDQGLAPFKTLAGASGVNFTAGLPIVRTSPDHGTAYDIAGKGLADETSMRNAIYEAIDILRRRHAWHQARRNPLRKQYVERGADKTIDITKEEATD